MVKKSVISFVFVFLLVSVGVFAEAVSEGAVSQEVSDYIGSFVEKGGITKDKINKVKKLNQSDLPDEVDIKNIEENQIGIYEVNYTEGEGERKLFVVTYSTNEFKKSSSVATVKNIQYLNFGSSGFSKKSEYLDSSTGVKTGRNVWYVMMKSGSITGISTSLELEKEGNVVVNIYKNGEDTGFSNLISSGDKRKIDYDLQSENIVTYEAGDVISVYVESSGEVNWGNVVTTIELTNN